VILLNEKVDATWGVWHVLKIRWTASSISFFVDGVEVSSFSTMGCESHFDSAILPVGIWNDRLSEMLVDWVFVTPKNVWLDQYDVANILADLTDTTPGTRPNFFDYKNSYERIAQFSEEKGLLFSSSIYTTSTGD